MAIPGKLFRVSGDQWFESRSLQRRVRNEPSAAGSIEPFGTVIEPVDTVETGQVGFNRFHGRAKPPQLPDRGSVAGRVCRDSLPETA